MHAILARFEVVVEPFLALKEAIMDHTVVNFCWTHVGRFVGRVMACWSCDGFSTTARHLTGRNLYFS